MRTFTTAKQSLEEIAAAIAPDALVDLKDKEAQVREIVEAVRQRGDRAVCEFVRRFDGAPLTPKKLKVKNEEFRAARRQIGKAFEKALECAADNIRRFHERQRPTDRFDLERAGNVVGERFTPLERVGIHVPGATATYPSSVLMTVIPAQVAGVKEIHIATPPASDMSINPATLAAADILGVHSVFRMAGAQAIAAFAFGTETVPKVDKIVGPGNIYATLAKRQVFGAVGIDGLYGPSEVVVLADESANSAWVAADLLAQSEHGPDSCAILISPDSALIEQVEEEVAAQARRLPRQGIAWEAWMKRGALVKVRDISEGLALSNLIAPEHLELHLENALAFIGEVKHAGCILLGPYSPAAVSDYLAGPSHCLPTGRSATFSSGLGVMDFMKRSDVVSISASYLAECAEHIRQFASLEDLEGHYRAVELRLRRLKSKKQTK
jgi:histidinol dehydrogenase